MQPRMTQVPPTRSASAMRDARAGLCGLPGGADAPRSGADDEEVVVVVHQLLCRRGGECLGWAGYVALQRILLGSDGGPELLLYA